MKVVYNKYKEITRDVNLVTELENLHNCPVHLGILVVGCYGEILNISEFKTLLGLLKRLGISEKATEHMMVKISYSVAVSTSTIILRRKNCDNYCDNGVQ